MRRCIFALTIGLLSAATARGQLRDCDHHQVTSPKVLLDGVRIMTAEPGPSTRAFQERVRRRLWMRLNGLPELLASEGGVNLVECRNRVPSGSGAFDPPTQTKMLDDGVLLEFWACVDSTSTDDDQPAFEAQVQWVSFPLGRSTDISLANQGFFSKPLRVTLSESTRAVAVDSLLTPQRLLVAHVLLSIAIADLSAKEYADAYRRLCMARARLCADDAAFGRTLDDWIKRTADMAKAAGKPLVGADVAGAGEGGCP